LALVGEVLIYAPQLWLDVSWAAMQALATIVRASPVIHDQTVQHELENIACACEAQLQKRAPASSVADLL